ncbi:hypothetical protein MVEN_01436900 [Mycena venus]|uniref:CxC5 like cysteine cluster associated with KDZ domain-containing protein n=1 Tax=Mycena venus TaxID=2733690 RepID=A0A8H6XZB5_9AGAR|nr:hypothetical protein MVEN_01436900 [Mycena venus]
MDFQKICDALKSCPEVAQTFAHTDVVKYIELVGLLKPTPALAYLQRSHQLSVPPPTLPANVHEFLRACFDVPDETAKLAWNLFRQIAWEFKPAPDEQKANRIKHVKLFLSHGIEQHIGVYSLSPPTRVCLDPDCGQPLFSDPSVLRDKELAKVKDHPITIFTLDLGAVPGFSTSVYCRNCHTRYYHNYYVHDRATTRTYYLQDNIPEFIQSAEHFYTSANLCEPFANMMATASTSATNCARIYNTSISQSSLEPLMPTSWPNLQMDVEDVYNSFFLHALLLDHHERGDIFELQHNAPSQAERLRPALDARNFRMAGTGQEEWNHICDLCCYIYQDDSGRWMYIRSNITDGYNMGHFCCTVHDCQNRLRTVKDSFCAEHQLLKKQCCVTTCREPVEVGFRTCGLPDHREAELYHYQKGKAMFQLKDRLQRAKASNSFPPPPHNSIATSRLPTSQLETMATGVDLLPDAGDLWDVDTAPPNFDEGEETEYTCEGKSSQGNQKIKAFFGRRSTHNEQLSAWSCGVIAGSATFFGSEAPNAVREFWMKLFPTKASLPAVLWHDNNCSIVKMLRNDPDEYRRTYFDHVALPVDVFHFKSKHKETDTDCGANCNPYIWPELRTADGKWRFNSSAAEQANAWFGGFQSMVREMPVERYNFFLDEMIKRRNRTLIKDLQRRGKNPGSIPREVLIDEYDADEMDSSTADFGWEGMVSSGEQFPGLNDYYNAPGFE